jgi:lipoate-protein ligase A
LTKHKLRLETLAFGRYDADYNMALDLHLFTLCDSRAECGFLRFYTWSGPTLSLGYFEDAGVIDMARVLEDGVRVVRRPTGGRAVLHGDDLTYAVVTSREAGRSLLETYRMISECIVSGLARLGIDAGLERSTAGKSDVRRKPCFVSTSRYEILHQGRKVAGSAQKAGSTAVLQHGSIPLGRGYLRVADYMACDDRERANLLADIDNATCCISDLLGSCPSPEDVAGALIRGFSERFDLADRGVHPDKLYPYVTDAPLKARERGFRTPESTRQKHLTVNPWL